jgi:predicted extracellular nuclease
MTNTLPTRFFWLALLTALIAVVISTSAFPAASAPLAAISLSTPYNQNFDTLATSGTANTWTNDSTISGWYSNRVVYRADGGTSNTGALYSYGNATDAERSLGSVASGSTTTIYYGAQFVNDTGATITELSVSYTGEQWRNGGNTTPHTLDFQYQVNAEDISNGTWTDVDTLDFTGPIATSTAGAINPPATANPSATFSVTVAAGDEIWIRWQDVDNTGSDHGLSVDNLTVSVPGGGTPTPTNTPGGPTLTPTNTSVPATPTATATSTPTNTCGDPATFIYNIQGSGANSPDDGLVRTIEGVVVGDFQGASGLNGFNVQEETGDGNPATSDGIFVFAPSAPDVSVGQVVRVVGTVDEFNGLTELTSVTQTTICGTAPLPTPVAINLPVTAITDFEPFEGMYVTFPQTLHVTEVFGVGRYGEVGLSVNGRRFQPTNIVEPGAPANAQQSLNDRSRILLDDGSNTQNPAVVPYLAPDNTLRPDDTTPSVTGVLSYAFSFYRIYPTTTVTFTRANPRDLTPEAVGGTVQVASFNVLNYFTTIDNGSNDARGADSVIEFQRQRTKIVEAMLGLDADVLGLIEIENNQTAIDDLVATLNISSTAPYTIAPGLPGTYGTDAIKVAIIYRPSAATPVGTAQIDTNAINNRPTVAQAFEVNGQIFTVVINHFKSKGCGGATGADTDQGDGQSCFNATRILQAQRLLTFLDQVETTVGDDDFVLLGDFNAYAKEDPLDVLKSGGFTSLSETFLPAAEQYSYVFFGQSGELDHGFVSNGFLADVNDATTWHINSDEPIDLDYNDDVLTSGEGPADFNQPYLYQPNAFRSSDHDPLLIGLDLQPTSVTFFPGNIPVTEANTTVTVTVALTQALDVPVTLDYSTSDGTATEGEDYVAASGTLTVAAGVTSTTFTVDILDDTDVEGSETVILEVTPDSVPLLGGGTVTGTITIAEGALTTVDFSAPNYNVTEANTTATITVTLSQALSVPAVLDYFTANGTATAGSDYITATGTITVPAGSTSGTFTVQVLDDTTDEPDETVILNVGPGTLGLMGDVVTGTLTILDNDLPPTAVTVASMDVMPNPVSALPWLALAGLAVWGMVVVLRRR